MEVVLLEDKSNMEVLILEYKSDMEVLIMEDKCDTSDMEETEIWQKQRVDCRCREVALF